VGEARQPLPPSVYRRRRIVATAGTAVGALLFIWAIGALLGGGDTPSVRGAANIRDSGVALATTAPASNPPATGRLAARGSATNSPSASASRPAATTTTTTSVPPPGPPQPCPDSVIRVTATSEQPGYLVGEHPVLILHIANGGPVPCVRDISHQYRSVLVLSADGKTRLWSSSDCYQLTTNEIRTLQPNESLTYGVAWGGRTSAPGCPVHRATVGAGTYQLVGQLGSITGPPAILTLS
jgi:hypothetical protein